MCMCICARVLYALLKVHCHSFTVLFLSWKLVKSCSLFVLYILQGCALIGIMFLALIVLLHVVTCIVCL